MVISADESKIKIYDHDGCIEVWRMMSTWHNIQNVWNSGEEDPLWCLQQVLDVVAVPIGFTSFGQGFIQQNDNAHSHSVNII